MTDNKERECFWSRKDGDVSRRGEYSVMSHYFAEHPPSAPVVCDVGACCRRNSNSYNLIAELGWSGVLAEASPEAAERCRQEFPEGTMVVEKAVADYRGEATFYLSDMPETHSLCEEWKPTHRAGTIRVPVITLADILREHAVPPNFGVLSVDTEGSDEQVVRPMIEETHWRPDFLIVEKVHAHQPRLPWAGLLEDAGYVLYWDFQDNWLWARRQ